MEAKFGSAHHASQASADRGRHAQGARRWYVVQTRPRQEQRAELNLRNQDYVTYEPCWPVERLHRGRRVDRSEPLFPGYLFVRLRPSVDNFRPIFSTRGVLRLVSFGNEPTPIEDTVIECIRQRVGSSETPASALAAGEPVEILGGPFRGLEAVFQSFDGRERAVLLLNMMQQEVRAVQPLANIRRA